MRRPYSFKRFIKKNGSHAVYLLTTQTGNPVKVGIAEDPLKRFSGLQVSHFMPSQLYRFWWTPGRPISGRIQSAFKKHFAPQNVRGRMVRLASAGSGSFYRDLHSLGYHPGRTRGLGLMRKQRNTYLTPLSVDGASGGKLYFLCSK